MSHPTTTWSLSPSAVVTSTGGVSQFSPGVDWELDVNGDVKIPLRFTTGLTAVTQGIRIRVQMFTGEWFRDLDAGVDYWGKILGQKFDAQTVRAEFRDEILKAPGVAEILSLQTGFDGATRSLTVAWHVRAQLDNLVGEIKDSFTLSA